MVLGRRLPGRVGRRRNISEEEAPALRGLLRVPVPLPPCLDLNPKILRARAPVGVVRPLVGGRGRRGPEPGVQALPGAGLVPRDHPAPVQAAVELGGVPLLPTETAGQPFRAGTAAGSETGLVTPAPAAVAREVRAPAVSAAPAPTGLAGPAAVGARRAGRAMVGPMGRGHGMGAGAAGALAAERGDQRRDPPRGRRVPVATAVPRLDRATRGAADGASPALTTAPADLRAGQKPGHPTPDREGRAPGRLAAVRRPTVGAGRTGVRGGARAIPLVLAVGAEASPDKAAATMASAGRTCRRGSAGGARLLAKGPASSGETRPRSARKSAARPGGGLPNGTRRSGWRIGPGPRAGGRRKKPGPGRSYLPSPSDGVARPSCPGKSPGTSRRQPVPPVLLVWLNGWAMPPAPISATVTRKPAASSSLFLSRLRRPPRRGSCTA
jgi:hypothetical protein